MRPHTIPEFFWDSMSNVQREIIAPLAMVYSLYPSGSRYICPAHVHVASGWDLAAMVPDGHWRRLIDEGWISGGSSIPSSRSRSFKRENINLIAFDKQHPDEFNRFMFATEICKLLGGPVVRGQRVALFEAIKTGHYDANDQKSEMWIAADHLEDNGFEFCETLRNWLRWSTIKEAPIPVRFADYATADFTPLF